MSDDNVVEFRGATFEDINPDVVLTGSIGTLDEVVVIGTRKNGEIYLASSRGGCAEIMWLIEQAKAEILEYR